MSFMMNSLISNWEDNYTFKMWKMNYYSSFVLFIMNTLQIISDAKLSKQISFGIINDQTLK